MGNIDKIWNTILFTKQDLIKCGDCLLPLSQTLLTASTNVALTSAVKSQDGDAQKRIAMLLLLSV